MERPTDHPGIPEPKTGVLLVNLGSPAAPTRAAVRRYLAEFLSDPRVVEIPVLLWQPILRGLVLNVRPAKSAKLYASIWDRDRGGSPLALHTADQAKALQHRRPDIVADWAMRYGTPSIGDRLEAMKMAGCERILVAPLYPQYCGATTATVVDAVGTALRGMRWQPAIRYLPPYGDDEHYIAAVAGSLSSALQDMDFRADMVLASFHGMPRRTLELGDPYHCQCLKTARLIGERVPLPVEAAFQSRFGRAEWLRPYLDETLAALPGRGIKKIAIIAPGFAADCLETLEEIAIRGRTAFLSAGGERFHYVPCLNAEPRGMEMLSKLVARELSGWTESA